LRVKISLKSTSVRPGSACLGDRPKRLGVLQHYGAESGTNSIYACHISQDHDNFPRKPDLSDRVTQAHVIATILDPRFKLQALKGPQWTESRLHRAKQLIRSEYSHYERVYNKLNPEETLLSESNSQISRLAVLQAEIYGASEEETNEITRYLFRAAGRSEFRAA
jgi:hypothetical protein